MTVDLRSVILRCYKYSDEMRDSPVIHLKVFIVIICVVKFMNYSMNGSICTRFTEMGRRLRIVKCE